MKKKALLVTTVSGFVPQFEMLRFQLFVPDRIQADYIKKNFLKDPSAFYGKIIQYLTKPELPEK